MERPRPAEQLPRAERRDRGTRGCCSSPRPATTASTTTRRPVPTLPASFDLPNIISVAAIDNTGRLADFSNYGRKTVDIAAPGVAILSSVPAYDGDHGHFSFGWDWLDGTSMAAPHVTGTAALVASYLPALAANPIALRARILGSGKADADTSGLTATGRLVDAFRAIDAVPPTASAASAFGFLTGSVVGTTTIRARAMWPAAVDDLTGIQSYDAALSARGGAFRTQVVGTTARTAYSTLAFKTPYTVRIRARDRAGNLSGWVVGRTFEPRIYQETTSFATYHGTWSSTLARGSSAGRERSSTRAGASVTFQFTGQAFGIVATRGPSRGQAKVWIDGAYLGVIDLHSAATKSRVVVLNRAWTARGSHTVKFVVVGTSGHPRFDVDALLLMR